MSVTDLAPDAVAETAAGPRVDRGTAIVTGGRRGIGAAVAMGLAEAGFAVAIVDIVEDEAAAATLRTIRSGGGRGLFLRADIADIEGHQRLIETITTEFGPLTCLVNNASCFERDEALSVTRASWDAHLETNLRAPFVLMQEFARLLPPDRSGAIVNILDERVWNLTPHFVSYTLSKAGLWTLTQVMAMALAPRIRVNGIGPGPTLPSPRQSAEQFARQQASVPLQHGATPEEIAAAVRFILSSGAMTGQMIALDGGQHLGWAQPGQVLQTE